MATQATVFCQNVNNFSLIGEYYRATGREPSAGGAVPVDPYRVVYFSSFSELVAKLLSEKKSYVVVVCHGTPENGIEVPFGPTSGKYHAGPLMYPLLHLVRQRKKGALNAALLADTAARGGITQTDLKKLVEDCFTIRNAPDICLRVHIRGCSIGRTSDSPFEGDSLSHIQRHREIFNSIEVTAPTVPMFFVRNVPYYPRDVKKFATSNAMLGRRFIYERPNLGPYLLDILKDGSSASSRGAVTQYADIASWAKIMHETKTTAATTSIVLAGLWPVQPDRNDVYFLAHEPGYSARINSTVVR